MATAEEILSENERAVSVDLDGTTLVFGAPSVGDYERFQSKISNSSSAVAAESKILCFACLLHPTREELKAIFSKYPAVPQQIAMELHNLAGGDVEVEVKKG